MVRDQAEPIRGCLTLLQFVVPLPHPLFYLILHFKAQAEHNSKVLIPHSQF